MTTDTPAEVTAEVTPAEVTAEVTATPAPTATSRSRKHGDRPRLQALHVKAKVAYAFQYALNPKRYVTADKALPAPIGGTRNTAARHTAAVEAFHGAWATYAAACKKAGVKP